MMQTTIFYFSGTGNTYLVGQWLTKDLISMGQATRLVNIEQVSDEQLHQYLMDSNRLGIGYPIYGSDVPLVMQQFLRKLSHLSQRYMSKTVFIFVTQEAFSGDGARVACEFLQTAHWSITHAVHINMPSNISASLIAKLFGYLGDDEAIRLVLVKARAMVSNFAQSIMTTTQQLVGFNMGSYLLGLIQRIPFRLGVPLYRKWMRINQNKCIHCGLCLEQCPVGNISFQDGEYSCNQQCINCMRCYNACPVAAFEYLKTPHDNQRGRLYQISKWSHLWEDL
jgi:NAD-dependent dihydropyrimidine dehydrogenase PreA subunit/flavodoxin